jgi:ATP-independent RNA helicase DbpA
VHPTKFSELNLSDKIIKVVEELGFENLTSIQAQSIPLLLAKKDLIGQSQTGSGKTAAFTIPILEAIDLQERVIQAMILCPTRELAAQVAGEIRKLGRRFESLKVLVVAGGAPSRAQIESLENGVHIVVGTPGRILDIGSRGRLDVSALKTIVMDEADKMLEMGFEDEIRAIMQEMPKSRQTIFFSATFPESIQTLSQNYQKNPVRVVIEEQKDTTALIDEIVYQLDQEEKVQLLMRVLQQHPSQATLVFCNQKATVDDLVQVIAGQNVSCAALHGDLEQRDRDRVMSMFRNGSHRILVATDVAARGLDIESLDLVVNYDFPQSPEVYVHRIGRTGRAGRKGVAVTFARLVDDVKVFEIEKARGKKFAKPILGFKNQYGLSALAREASMQTLMISGGRKDKLRPGDILGALTGDSGSLKANDIGKIEIQDKFSYVAVSSDCAELAAESLRAGKIKGRKFQVRLVKL